jgi:ClpP class serine protease
MDHNVDSDVHSIVAETLYGLPAAGDDAGLRKEASSRVITMIHRQETMSLLGFPISRYIDIEDSEKVLRAIRMTPKECP